MSQELYPGSPVAPLADALGDRVVPGGIGLVLAPAGVGKSAMLVHLALQALLRQVGVLHVALTDTVDHARAHYDEIFRAIAAQGKPLSDGREVHQAQVGAERNRMIHSFAGRPFDVHQVEKHLALLTEAAQFSPEVLVVDAMDPAELLRNLSPLADLARKVGAFVWLGVRIDPNAAHDLAPELLQTCAAILRLRPDGPLVEVSLDGTAHAFPTDPSSLLRPSTADVAQKMAGTVHPGSVTLYTGGAKGSEACFGEVASRYGLTEVAFTFEGHMQARSEGRYELSPSELAAGDVSLQYVSKRLHRTYNDQGGLIRGVLQTLWHMVSRSQQVFVVGVIQPDDTVKGGTGWSVELARMWSRDLWVFDQERGGWHRWDNGSWVAGTPIIRSLHVTGTGTRMLQPGGREAIEELFARSFQGLA